MGRMKPYQMWNKLEMRDMLETHVDRLDLPDAFKMHWIRLIYDAFRSGQWNVLHDYNGCSLVQDLLHPDPACFVHDFMMITGHGGTVCDRIFYHCMIATGMAPSKAWRRWFAVRVGWFCFYMWKYMVKRRLKPITKTMADFDKYLKK